MSCPVPVHATWIVLCHTYIYMHTFLFCVCVFLPSFFPSLLAFLPCLFLSCLALPFLALPCVFLCCVVCCNVFCRLVMCCLSSVLSSVVLCCLALPFLILVVLCSLQFLVLWVVLWSSCLAFVLRSPFVVLSCLVLVLW